MCALISSVFSRRFLIIVHYSSSLFLAEYCSPVPRHLSYCVLFLLCVVADGKCSPLAYMLSKSALGVWSTYSLLIHHSVDHVGCYMCIPKMAYGEESVLDLLHGLKL